MTDIGPVQLMSLRFEPGANFEGRIIDELVRLEGEGTIRLLDLLFVLRDTESDELVVVDHAGTESMGSIVGSLMGVRFEGDAAGAAPTSAADELGLTQADIDEMSSALAPGEAAGIMVIEHAWARPLRAAIRDAGGHMMSQGFLTPETISSQAPDLAALSRSIHASEG